MPRMLNVVDQDAAAVLDFLLSLRIGQKVEVIALINGFAFFWLIQSQAQAGSASAKAFKYQSNRLALATGHIQRATKLIGSRVRYVDVKFFLLCFRRHVSSVNSCSRP